MKRELFDNVKVLPYTSGAAIDRQGFLSALLTASVSVGTKISVAVTLCDTESGSYVAAPDGVLLKGAVDTDLTAPATVGYQLDLAGCKRYVKITATLTGSSATATYALALGDAAAAPMEG